VAHRAVAGVLHGEPEAPLGREAHGRNEVGSLLRDEHGGRVVLVAELQQATASAKPAWPGSKTEPWTWARSGSKPRAVRAWGAKAVSAMVVIGVPSSGRLSGGATWGG
jgi:hypothetical protein